MTDQIEFSKAVMCGAESPDIRDWPVMSGISRVIFAQTQRWPRGNVYVDFAGKMGLQPGIGNQGPISWTLWGGFYRAGQWCFAPLVECVGDDYIPTGGDAPGFVFSANHVADNLLYYADSPINRYQPQPGEQIAMVVTTGDTRRQNAQPVGFVPRRTNVVLVPFQVGDWTFSDVPVPIPTPIPTPSPLPSPVIDAETRAQITRLYEQVQRHEDRLTMTDASQVSLASSIDGLKTRMAIVEGLIQSLQAMVKVPTAEPTTPAPSATSQQVSQAIGGIISGWLGGKKK